LFLLLQTFAHAQSINVVRSMPTGSTVTVSGIVTNGAEFGNNTRYLQDATAGINGFSNSLSNVQRGDEVTLTGVLYDFNGLLELSPVSLVVVNSNGNTLPQPVSITPTQMGETYESQLVQIQNAVFTNGGQTFNGSTNYTYSANGQSGTIRINGNSNLVGTIIPTQPVSITGICSQFFANYQLLPRDVSDISLSSSLIMTQLPEASNISTTGFRVSWQTNLLPAQSYIVYGKTPALELGMAPAIAGTTSEVFVTGAMPSELYYMRCFSVLGTDTAASAVGVFITQSVSSGKTICYFNKSVDNSVSTTTPAITLPNTIDDTLIAYINRAKQSIDVAIYNFNQTNLSDIAGALNNAYTSGKTVRLIYNSNTSNTALTLLNPGINLIGSPNAPGYGIMHNKFVVIDAYSNNANDALVWTGSTNWTEGQINDDANNVIIIQDKSLAIAYTLEFNEMYGSPTSTPNTTAAKFGFDKGDNTPHEFVVGGKRLQCYFSPTDNVNNRIIETLNTAQSTCYFALLSFTRFDVASTIDVLTQQIFLTAGIIDDSSGSASTAYNIMSPVMGNKLQVYNHAIHTGVMHHKYAIIDESAVNSDPQVLTGSHNWSSSATQRNDENTVIVHDATIANQYYQEFYKRFYENGGVLAIDNNNSLLQSFILYPNPSNGTFKLQVNLAQVSNIKVTVIDMHGRVVFQNETETTEKIWQQNLTLNVTAGIYVVKVTAGTEVLTQKLLVQ
ncbi:MAG TPA: phospholipase D-like domain-containing protein, partial [Bacteroidia bacterium]|nr:phospholipase D-like domain-containing protein [Bacteroidia bacterium]